MAEFNRSLSTPIEARNRSRNHVSCPRCRVDPSHISRQFWEATRPQQQQQDLSNNNILEVRSGGYPDLCRRSNRSYTSPASVHQYQQRPAAAAANTTTTGYYTSGNNAGFIRYSSDTHSTRSTGDTWRIRGILEDHPPDVTRRAESSMGRLPDVTHHTQSTLPIVHARTRSVPVGGVYDSRVPSNSSYDIHSQNQPHMVSRSSTQGIICPRNHQDTMSHASLPVASNNANNNSRHQVNTVTHNRPEHHHTLPSSALTNSHWKREQQTSTNNNCSSPWVTMDRHVNRSSTLDRHLTLDRQLNASASSNSSNNITNNNNNINNNSLTWSNQQQNSSSNSNNNSNNNGSCWRPNTVTTPSQNVLNPCPLPDLVTPRRQARKQCCGLLATHSVAIRWLVVVIAFLGLLCSVVGTIVGVVKATGREHLTVALLLIGKSAIFITIPKTRSCSPMIVFAVFS